MKNYFKQIFTIVFFTLILTAIGFAQTTTQTPIPTPVPTPVPTPRPVIQQNRPYVSPIEAQIRREELSRRQEKLRLAQKTVDELYRKPTKKELLTVDVDTDLKTKYEKFLEQENTGLIRLLKDEGCAENSTVVNVSENCLQRTMPGSGSSFSFRFENYRIPRLADLSFSGEQFLISGSWLHGLMVLIGDVPLEKISPQTDGFQFLVDFKPALEYESAKKIDYKLTNGIKDGKLVYARSVRVIENVTYLLRSVAYRGIVRKSVEGFLYNELDFDKRKDIVVAFRVVRRHPDGSVTIIWKQLFSKQSPKILLNDDKKNSKIKENKYVAKGKR